MPGEWLSKIAKQRRVIVVVKRCDDGERRGNMDGDIGE